MKSVCFPLFILEMSEMITKAYLRKFSEVSVRPDYFFSALEIGGKVFKWQVDVQLGLVRG